MLRGFGRRCTFAVAMLIASGSPARAEPDVRLPPGSHRDSDGQMVSGRGLRDTTDWLTKELDRRGVAVDKIGPYRSRGVELTRFVSRTPATPWLAIHVVRIAGKTVIFFVARPST